MVGKGVKPFLTPLTCSNLSCHFQKNGFIQKAGIIYQNKNMN